VVEVDVKELVAVEVEEPLAPVEGRQQHPGEVGVEGLAGVDVARPVTAPVVAVRRDGRGARLLREPRLGPGVLGVEEDEHVAHPGREVALDEEPDASGRVLDRADREDHCQGRLRPTWIGCSGEGR
jgi:hypothetical protein